MMEDAGTANTTRFISGKKEFVLFSIIVHSENKLLL